MSDLYLTIDDSPSANFTALCAYLKSKNIPAVFFARGDLLSLYPNETIQAIKDGFVIANHSWSHHHASKLGADMAIKEVLKTQTLIEKLYLAAGVKLPGPYMRFPHMDSGLGGWPLPPETFTSDEQADLRKVYGTFYNNTLAEPGDVAVARHNAIEEALRARGFRQMQFPDIHVDWYNRYAASSAVSTQGTFSHPDWIMYKRHEGRVPPEQRNIAALNKNFDDFTARHGGAQILVMHESVELWPTTKALLDHMIEAGHSFLPVPD